MLQFFGRAQKFCDGVSRRDFLSLGTLALGGLTLPQLLQAREASPTKRQKSAIMIFLSGGPAHLDTWDMKPDLPAELRGEFTPIQTKVPGIELCEWMPLQARMADKFAILRGVRTVGNHTGNEFFSGFAFEQGNAGSKGTRHPALGSFVSRLRPNASPLPNYVSLHDNPTWEQAYWLGSQHMPFRVFKNQRANEGLANMTLQPGLGLERVGDRRQLLQAFDRMRRDLEAQGAFDSQDAMRAKALEMVTSSQVRDAFDISKESERTKARYGSAPAAFGFVPGQEFMQARRLVEAGVPIVTLAIHGWDTHEKNFETLRKQLPILDQAFTALISDLEERGLLDDVVVMMGGEMGRTPRITADRAGREHWPESGTTIMAGGGLKVGQVVGASDAKGEQPRDRAITPQMMLATLYAVLGINPATTLPDHNGRPIYLLSERERIHELL